MTGHVQSMPIRHRQLRACYVCRVPDADFAKSLPRDGTEFAHIYSPIATSAHSMIQIPQTRQTHLFHLFDSLADLLGPNVTAGFQSLRIAPLGYRHLDCSLIFL